jgi:hypothetical protein
MGKRKNAISARQFMDAHYMWGSIVQYPHYDLNPHYLGEAKTLNPYIKHKTFLVEFDDHVKTIEGD